MIAFCGIFDFRYRQVCCVTLSSRAFLIFVNGVKMHVQHSWKNLYLKSLNVILMEWKPQYLFYHMNWTVELLSDCGAACTQGLHRLHLAFFTFRVVSRISHSCVLFEVRPRPDVAVLFKHWLCYRWDCSVFAAQFSHSTGHGAMEGTRRRRRRRRTGDVCSFSSAICCT